MTILLVGAVAVLVLCLGATGVALVVSLAVVQCALMLGFVIGPAASITVDPARVVVNNVFVQFRVPRRMIQGISTVEAQSVALRLTDGSCVPMSALVPGYYRLNAAGRGWKRTLRQAARIQRMLRECPPNDDTVVSVRRLRWRNIVLVGLSSGLFLTVAVLIWAGAVTPPS